MLFCIVGGTTSPLCATPFGVKAGFTLTACQYSPAPHLVWIGVIDVGRRGCRGVAVAVTEEHLKAHRRLRGPRGRACAEGWMGTDFSGIRAMSENLHRTNNESRGGYGYGGKRIQSNRARRNQHGIVGESGRGGDQPRRQDTARPESRRGIRVRFAAQRR